MPRMALRSFVHPNNSGQAVIEMMADNEALGNVVFEPAEIDGFIHHLAKVRAALSEPVIPELDPTSRLEAVINPRFFLADSRLEQGRILSFRHPGLGWLSFVLPDNHAATIAEWLTKVLPQRKSK